MDSTLPPEHTSPLPEPTPFSSQEYQAKEQANDWTIDDISRLRMTLRVVAGQNQSQTRLLAALIVSRGVPLRPGPLALDKRWFERLPAQFVVTMQETPTHLLLAVQGPAAPPRIILPGPGFNGKV